MTLYAAIVKTSPRVADDERIRGWGTVVRELLATLFLLAVVAIGLSFAVRAGRAGCEPEARRAIIWHEAALPLILLIVMNGSTENIMTTRPAAVKWLLLPLQLGVTAGATALCRRRIRTVH